MNALRSTAANPARELAFFGVEYGPNESLPLILDGIERYASGALDALYSNIAADPALAQLFSGRAAMQHARAKQLEHWQALFSRGIDAEFIRKSEQIGMIHARTGLDPVWYIGGYAQMIETVVTGMMAQSARRRLSGTALSAAIGIFFKTAMFDMQIALSAYFKAETATRSEAIEKIGSALSALANGDVSNRLTGLSSEYAQIEFDFEAMRGQLHATIEDVTTSTEMIRGSASEIAAAASDLARRTEQQAASVEETAAAMEQITGSVRQAAGDANEIRLAVEGARGEADAGSAIVRQAIDAMGAIEQSSTKISDIVSLIDGISFQTNLLALNAGVEAARAGSAGLGFAVVANEVRALAQRSADAAQEIKELINSSSVQVQKGVQLVGQSGDALDRIAQRITQMNARIADIASASELQASRVVEVNAAVVSMDSSTQQNAAMVEESTAAAAALSTETGRLAQLVARFRLAGNQRGGQAPVAIHRAPARTAAPAAAPAFAPRQRVAAMASAAVAVSQDDWTEF